MMPLPTREIPVLGAWRAVGSSTQAYPGLTLTLAGADHGAHQRHGIWLEGRGNGAVGPFLRSALPVETGL